MVEPISVPCQECAAELAGDGPELRLELSLLRLRVVGRRLG
jgi:hypothetical protein